MGSEYLSIISPLMCLDAAEKSSFSSINLSLPLATLQGESSKKEPRLDESPAGQKDVSLCVLNLYNMNFTFESELLKLTF